MRRAEHEMGVENLEFEKLKDLVLEYLVVGELLRIVKLRIDELQEWFAGEVVKENIETLRRLGVKASEKLLAKIIVDAITETNYVVDDSERPVVLFGSGYFIEVSSKENAKKVAELIESMVREYKRRRDNDLGYQDAVKVYKYLNVKHKELYGRIYNPWRGAIPTLVKMIEEGGDDDCLAD